MEQVVAVDEVLHVTVLILTVYSKKKRGVTVCHASSIWNGRRDGRLRGCLALRPRWKLPAVPPAEHRLRNPRPASDPGRSDGNGRCKTENRAIPRGCCRPCLGRKSDSVPLSSETHVSALDDFFAGLALLSEFALGAVPLVADLSALAGLPAAC